MKKHIYGTMRELLEIIRKGLMYRLYENGTPTDKKDFFTASFNELINVFQVEAFRKGKWRYIEVSSPDELRMIKNEIDKCAAKNPEWFIKPKKVEFPCTATWSAVKDPLYTVDCPNCECVIFMSSPSLVERLKRWAYQLAK